MNTVHQEIKHSVAAVQDRSLSSVVGLTFGNQEKNADSDHEC